MGKINATPLSVGAPTRRHSGRTPEAKVVAAVKDWCRSKSDVYMVRIVQAGHSGVADFLLCVHGRFVAVECKAEGQRPRPLQEQQMVRVMDCGGYAIWGDTPETIQSMLEQLYVDLRPTGTAPG